MYTGIAFFYNQKFKKFKFSLSIKAFFRNPRHFVYSFGIGISLYILKSMKIIGFGIVDEPQIGFETPVVHTETTNYKSEKSGWFF